MLFIIAYFLQQYFFSTTSETISVSLKKSSPSIENSELTSDKNSEIQSEVLLCMMLPFSVREREKVL